MALYRRPSQTDDASVASATVMLLVYAGSPVLKLR